MHVTVIASASGQWPKLVALGQMLSVVHRRRNGKPGHRAPYRMRDFNIDAMGVAWKESRQISVVPLLALRCWWGCEHHSEANARLALTSSLLVTQSVLLTDLAAQCAMPTGIESADRGPSQSGASGERQSKLSTSKNLSILTSLLINEINIRIV